MGGAFLLNPGADMLWNKKGEMALAENTNDVIIVGGGVIGCAIAYDLAASGFQVTLLERDKVGSQTSYGAGGMLAPQIEFANGGPGLDLGLQSTALYGEWESAIRERLGFGLDLDLSGVLRVTTTQSGQEELEAVAKRHKQMGYRARVLDREEIKQWAPGLSPRIQSGLWVPGGQVDASRVPRVLAQAAASHGAMIYTGVSVTAVEEGAVLTTQGRLTARYIVVAAGPWITQLLDVPLRPVKGQRILVELPHWLMRVPIFGETVYAVPKAAGRYFLGATEEPDGGYDRRPTLNGLTEVGVEAQLLFPALAKAEVVEEWAGLRPAFSDGLPIIDRVSGYERVLVAGGHYRHGFLLAPITARIVRDWMSAGTQFPEAFSFNRFDGNDQPVSMPSHSAPKVALEDEPSDIAGDGLQVEKAIAASPEAVYRAFCDPRHYARLMPDIRQVDVTEETASHRAVKWTVRYLGQQIVWTERQTWDGQENLQAELVDSNFFEQYRYLGRVKAHDAGSLVTIQVEMTSQRRGLVLAAARRVLKQNLVTFLDALGEELERESALR